MSSTPAKVDLLIIGGGPGGLATASTFARIKRPFLVYDSHSYRNANSKSAHTVPGFEGADPADYRKKVRKELERDYSWLEFRDDKIVSLERETGDGTFVAKAENGQEVRARKVVLATGLADKLPDIPGLDRIWGTRAVHCVFCHGTETRNASIALLLNPDTPMFNPMALDSFVKLWASLDHPKVYILTHGMDPETAEGREKSGLDKFMDVVKNRGYQIVSSPVKAVDDSSADHLTVEFTSGPSIQVGAINLFPGKTFPNPDSSSFLKSSLFNGNDLSPMGTIPILKPEEIPEGDPKFPTAFGDDPRTPVKGLFWAGNAGNAMGNINLSVMQGQAAGFAAAAELGKEDMDAELASKL